MEVRWWTGGLKPAQCAEGVLCAARCEPVLLCYRRTEPGLFLKDVPLRRELIEWLKLSQDNLPRVETFSDNYG